MKVKSSLRDEEKLALGKVIGNAFQPEETARAMALG